MIGQAIKRIERAFLVKYFSLGSGAITWSLKMQDVVALSSSEAEYMAVTTMACQAVWLRKLLSDFQQHKEDSTTIFCDNKATISMTKNPIFHNRTKDIDIRHHFIRDLVIKSKIILKYYNTDAQVADILTKVLPQAKHHFFKLKMGVNDFESRGVVE